MNGRSTPLSLKERREMYMLEQQGGETVGARAMEEVEVRRGRRRWLQEKEFKEKEDKNKGESGEESLID